MAKYTGKWPKTADVLKAEGYRSDQKWVTCSCGVRIFWVRTPSGARMPMEEVKTDDRRRRFQSHFASCQDAAHHGRK